MLLFGLFLVLVVLASSIELTNKSYIITLNGNILTNIRTTGESSDDLNLSGLGIGSIEEKAFENVTHVKNLDLANNSLSTLPEFIFSYFESLEHLSLADNPIQHFHGTTFSRLNHLISLNISNCPVKYLNESDFFGLGKFTDILTVGSSLRSLRTTLFKNPNQEEKFLETAEKTGNVHTKSWKYDFWVPTPILNSSLKVKLCLREGIVEKLEAFEEGEELESRCKEVKVDRDSRTVSLHGLGISSFSAGWYRLQGHPIHSLDLGGNNIVDLSSNILNDLPEGLEDVNLVDNKIERLPKGMIDNEHLGLLNFKNNLISEIEDNAFENTKLSTLLLNRNRLSDTRFVATLPSTLTEINLSNNRLNELPAGTFCRLTNLTDLFLSENNITEIKRESLRGLFSLRQLDMSYMNLKKIEPGSLQSLKALGYLSLTGNSLTTLEKGVFNGLEIIEILEVDANKFKKITSDTFHGLPDTLQDLNLSSNQIETLEIGSFVNVPYSVLSLRNNKITKFEKGTFNFSPLKKLNKNGFFSLNILKNPIKRLENGALCGLPKLNNSIVVLNNGIDSLTSTIELIQGGVFDDC